MKLLVVTPSLGTSPWLAETVAAVRAVAPGASHVLVVPAGAVAALQRQFPATRVLAEPGGGMYAAINAGVGGGGEWDVFTYINDDDVLLPAFRRVLQAGRSDAPQLVYGGVRLIDPAGRRLGAIPVSFFPVHNRALYAQRIEPVYQHGTLVSRAAWEQHGGFDPAYRFCGDSEFLARLCVRGVPAVHVGGEVAAFRLHRGQLTKNRPAMLAERARVDEQLGLRAAGLTARHHWARLVFRTANLPVYAGRVWRHGFASFDELLERAG